MLLPNLKVIFLLLVTLTNLSIFAQSKIPNKNKSGFVEFNNGKLYYEMKGKGQPVVLISGGGGMDLRQWDAQFKFLKKHFQVIRYDVRGIGRSDTPSVVYSNVADLKAVLDFLGIEKATLVGLSSGGNIALDFAVTHPERVNSLVLSGSMVRGFEMSEELKKRVDKFAEANKALDEKKITIEDVAQVFLDDPYFVPAPDNSKARKTAKRLMIENARDIPPNLEQQLNPPTATRVGEIKHPTLILIGNLDHPDLHRRMDFLLEKISGSKKVIINGGGHILNLEKPKEFNEAVFDFLKKK